MDVKLGRSHGGRNVGWGCWEYCGLRGPWQVGNGENYIMILMIRTPHPILLGWSKKNNEMGGHVASMGESRSVYRVLVGKPERQRRLGKPWRRWEANIKTSLQEGGCEGMDCIKLAQDRGKRRELVNAVMTFGFHTIGEISWLAENRLASQERLCSMQ